MSAEKISHAKSEFDRQLGALVDRNDVVRTKESGARQAVRTREERGISPAFLRGKK